MWNTGVYKEKFSYRDSDNNDTEKNKADVTEEVQVIQMENAVEETPVETGTAETGAVEDGEL